MLRSAISNVHNHEEEVPNNRTCYAVALSELISYMFELKQAAGDDLATFRLADLVKLYTDRILQLGVTDPSGNSTRLREQIMHHAPKLGVEDIFSGPSRKMLGLHWRELMNMTMLWLFRKQLRS